MILEVTPSIEHCCKWASEDLVLPAEILDYRSPCIQMVIASMVTRGVLSLDVYVVACTHKLFLVLIRCLLDQLLSKKIGDKSFDLAILDGC